MRREYIYSFKGRGHKVGTVGVSEVFTYNVGAHNQDEAERLLQQHFDRIDVCSVVRRPRALPYFTFHNVTVSIRAKTATEAYTLLCEQLSANDGDWHTTTYAEDDGEIRSTEELFPKE